MYENKFDITKEARFDVMCEHVLSFVDDENLKGEILDFLKTGRIGDYDPTGYIGRDDKEFEFSRRFVLALLMTTNKETFDYIKNNKIVYFHGTNANALPGIKGSGLRSLHSITQSGDAVSTGEEWSRGYTGQRGFISFSDVLSISAGYSELKPKTEGPDVETYDFPVIFGITKECMNESIAVSIHSDLQEVGARNDIPLEKIGVVMVPSDKVEFVKKILGDNVAVMPNDLRTEYLFYNFDGLMNICFDEHAYNAFINRANQKTPNLDALEIAKKTKLSSVKEAIEKFMYMFGKDNVYDESRPNSR